MTDSLGDRMKRYESVQHHHLLNKVPVVVRVDGKAFHTYAKGRKCVEPFDENLRFDMLWAASETARSMQGFIIAYHQSDEVSFALTDTREIRSEPHFGNDLQKIASVTASAFTAYFNARSGGGVALFDCRAFNVPMEELPNYFLWREKDWNRNSLSMYCRSFFSHKQLHGKGRAEQHEMLHSRGANWADLPDHWKNGTTVVSPLELSSRGRGSYVAWKAVIEEAMERDAEVSH